MPNENVPDYYNFIAECLLSVLIGVIRFVKWAWLG
jgi:hypothetical protein